MNRKKFERAVGDTTHAATDLGKEALAQASAYLKEAQDYLAPRAQDALHQAQDYLGPRAQDALHQASERITPLARDARKRGARLAADALDAVQPKLDEALSMVSPAVDQAYARIAPAVDDARSKVQYGFLPAVSQLLHEAADDLAKVELPEVPAPKRAKRSVWATIGQLLLAGGLLAGVVFAVKKFLAPADSGWQAHEPSKPYVPTSTQTLVDDLSTKASEAKDAAQEWLEDTGDKVAATGEKVSDAAADAGEELADAAADAGDDLTKAAEDAKAAADAEGGDAAPFAASPYGDGSYVGSEPPEGFVIKGNERSMKFHVQGNGGYERTIADVWFNSEDAAIAAGFTKAQR